MERDVDYEAENIAVHDDVTTWTDCSDVCRHVTSCMLWTYVSEKRQCVVKSRGHRRMRRSGYVSGTRICGTLSKVFSLFLNFINYCA